MNIFLVLASQWPEVFDIVITSAKKPYFYMDEGRVKGFRKIDPNTGAGWVSLRFTAQIPFIARCTTPLTNSSAERNMRVAVHTHQE